MTRILANLFLLMFLADGGISFLDELVSLGHPLAPLSLFRAGLGNFVVILAVTVYALLGIDKRLPKRVIVPLVLFTIFSPFLPLLVPSLAGTPALGLAIAVLQLLVYQLATTPIRQMTPVTVSLPKGLFKGPSYSVKNSAVFAAANLVILPCVLALLVGFTANAFMQRYTAGFMHLGPDGLHMYEKVYRRQNRTILLAGMIHVGEKEFYQRVASLPSAGRTIVLAEGVTDDRNLLRDRPDYSKLAGYLGLTSQADRMHFAGRVIEPSQLDTAPAKGNPGGVDILRADVDVSSFRPATIWFLNELGRQMKNSRTLSQQLLSSILWSQNNITPEIQSTVMDDILHRRNQVLIGNLDKALAQYDTVVVPWGALHMAEIEKEVRRQGFQLQRVTDRVSIRFGKGAAAPPREAGKAQVPGGGVRHE
ncbi:hypothetical protein L4X63_22005 [Geomonas sp. Red32]|uniref:hypothetical protein n=1 Tax=Geomonas sp. Red32 TaxID=2912856 RepID=UPI00202CDA0D|nr:hypothetical protein [Geomonas sp. Red32]MCM0084262.1 hypothetical protein [Geomonas sp. Red32]